MACERYRNALTDVAAGEPATAGVEAHLASCEACRAELLVLRRALAVADAEMAALATAEPSPGLAARIRQSVVASATNGPAPSEGPWLRFGWLWPAVAAAATLLVALTVLPGRGTGPTPEPRVAADGARPRPIETPAAGRPREPVIPRGSGLTGPEGSAGAADPSSPGEDVAPREDRPAEPEVLVPPGEAEALRRLVALVHRDGMAPALFGAAGEPSAEIASPAAIDIQPLEIVPLDPAETSGT